VEHAGIFAAKETSGKLQASPPVAQETRTPRALCSASRTAPKVNIHRRCRCYGYHPLVPSRYPTGTSIKRGSPQLGGRAAEAPAQRRLRSDVCCCRSTQSCPSRTNRCQPAVDCTELRPQRTFAAGSLRLRVRHLRTLRAACRAFSLFIAAECRSHPSSLGRSGTIS